MCSLLSLRSIHELSLCTISAATSAVVASRPGSCHKARSVPRDARHSADFAKSPGHQLESTLLS